MAYPTLPLRYRPADDIVLFGPHASPLRVGQLHADSEQIALKIRQVWPNPAHMPTILVSSRDPVAFIQGVFGCYKAGAVAACWSESTTGVEEVAALVGAEGLIDSSSTGEMQLHELGSTSWLENPPGNLIMMTSGSTGRSKGVSLDLEGVVINATLAGAAIGLHSARCEAWAIDIDFSMMSALNHFIMAWQHRLPVYYLRGMSQKDKAILLSKGDLGFGGAPLQLKRLLETMPLNVGPSIMVSSGDFLLPSVVGALREHFPASKIHSFYGLTEVSGRFCVLTDQEMRYKPDRTGAPLPGFGVQIEAAAGGGDKGEVELRTPLLFRGYYHSDQKFESTRPGQWFATGDLGQLVNGFLTLGGRSNDVFKVSGIKVDRHTIEQCIAEIINEADFCVLPVDHELIGQCPALFMAVSSKSRCLTWPQIIKHIKSRLSSHHIPMYGYSLPSLPRLPNGKLDKQRLINNRDTYERIS